MRWRDVLLSALSVNLLMEMYWNSNGPRDIFRKADAWAGDHSETLAYILDCEMCFATWAGLILVVLYRVARPLYWLIAAPLAIGRLVLWIHRGLSGVNGLQDETLRILRRRI